MTFSTMTTSTINGTQTISSGEIQSNNSYDQLIVGGTLNVSGGLRNNPNGHIYNNGTLNNRGQVSNYGSVVNIYGVINNQSGGVLYNSNYLGNVLGTLNNYSGGVVINQGAFNNYGSLNNSGILSNQAGLLYLDAGGSIVNDGLLINESYGRVVNNGTINNNSSSLISNLSDAILNNFGALNNSGTLVNSARGYLNNYGSLNNGGTIRNLADSLINNLSGGTLNNAAGATISNSFLFRNQAGATIVNDGVIHNYENGGLGNGGLLVGTGSFDGNGTNVSGGVIHGGDSSGGLYSGTLTFSSGTLFNSGSLINVSLGQGALVSNFGTASGNFVGSGASEIVLSGGTASADTVSAGGILTVAEGGSVAGETILSGGEIIVSGGSATDLTLAQGALVDFAGVDYSAGETVTVNGGQLEVFDSNGNVLASAGLYGGTYRGASYTVANDGSGHALVSVAICYLEGTQILTPTGEVKIETLKAGDTVVTRFGGLRKIRWIGRQSFRGETIKGDWKNIPVHIRAGALGDNVPSRDLYVSPGHSMLVDGTLLLAKHLVNGITITQGWIPEQVEYYQLDLGGHDCVLAEGAWSETFADGGALRDEFHNAADFVARYPNVRAPDAVSLCAPRPEKGEALAKGLSPILARAGLQAPGKLRGHVDKVHGGFKVEGWAQDLSAPDFPVTLEVLHDGVVLGEVLACDFRPDLQKAGIGRGYHAFTFVSPIRLTVEMHVGLSVRRKCDGVLLGMSVDIKRETPAAVSPLSQLPRLHVVA